MALYLDDFSTRQSVAFDLDGTWCDITDFRAAISIGDFRIGGVVVLLLRCIALATGFV